MLEIYREILEFHIATYEALRTQMDYFRYATNVSNVIKERHLPISTAGVSKISRNIAEA